MSETPNGGAPKAPPDQGKDDAPPQRPATFQDHVRTDGETAVDDALGSADDPR